MLARSTRFQNCTPRTPSAKLIVQVTETDESNAVELYRRGVRGVVPRSISPDLLVKCVRKIAEGETWIDNRSINWVIRKLARAQATSLTDPKVQPKLSKKSLAIISASYGACAIKRLRIRSGPRSRSSRIIFARSMTSWESSDRLELALYAPHHELLKKYTQELEGVILPQTEPCSHCARRCNGVSRRLKGEPKEAPLF